MAVTIDAAGPSGKGIPQGDRISAIDSLRTASLSRRTALIQPIIRSRNVSVAFRSDFPSRRAVHPKRIEH